MPEYTPDQREAADLAKMEKMQPLIARRVKNRDIRDGFNDPIKVPMPLPAPKGEALSRVAAVLKLYRSISKVNHKPAFPKCRHKDTYIAEKLDRENGISLEDIRAGKGFHTGERHVCSLCRCRRTAGWGSRGWWYWTPGSGLPEVGHYGVGPCFLHSPLYKLHNGGGVQIDRYRNRVLKEIEAMQQHGEAPDANAGYLVDMRQEAEVARQRQDTRTALHAIHKLANETITALRRHRETRSAEEDFLKETCAIFGFPVDMLDKDDRSLLLEIAQMRPLTEYVQGKLRPMSDDTSISLERGLLKDISQAAKTAFTVHEDQYTHNDDVLLLLERFYGEAEMAFRSLGEERWTEFVGALKDIGKGFADRSIEASALES